MREKTATDKNKLKAETKKVVELITLTHFHSHTHTHKHEYSQKRSNAWEDQKQEEDKKIQ